jgi:glycosyltransferase 2 family protein
VSEGDLGAPAGGTPRRRLRPPTRPAHESSAVRGLGKLFRTTLLIIPIGVLGNIAFSIFITDRDVLASVAGFPRDYLALAVGLTIIPWFTNALRLLIWTRFLGSGIGFREAFQITLATDLGAAISPTAVGGGFFKWGMLVQRGVTPGAAASLTSLAPMEDFIFFAVAVPLAVIITASWDLPVFHELADRFQDDALIVVLVGAGIALLSWLAVRVVLGGALGARVQQRSVQWLARTRRKLRGTWRDASEVFVLIRRNGKSRFALSMGLTGIGWIARYSVVSALVAFLGAPVQPVLYWLFQWVVFTLMTFIPTPGAAGGAEAVFFFIYSPFLPEEVVGLATAGWRFLTFYFLLGVASILFFLINLLPGEKTTFSVPPEPGPEDRPTG